MEPEEKLRIFINNTIEDIVCRCHSGKNGYISQSDFEEVAKPVATLAILNGYYWWASYGVTSYATKMNAYLKSLSFIVRIRDSREYLHYLRETIHSYFNTIRRYVRDNDSLCNYDLTIVIENLLEEAEK